MPLICKVNQTKPTVQLASVLPATVSTATNVYSSSSGLGSQVPIDSTIDRNTKTLVINPQPSLIPQAILESHESSMDRSLPKSQISAPEKGIQIPVVISNTQNLSGLHVLASNIVFGSVNSMNSSKPAKRHGLSDSLILVESDSQTLVQMVKGIAAVPWKLQYLLKRINLLFGMMNLQISHIYREANGIADFLASFAVQTKKYTEFSDSNILPVAGRLIQRQDQTGLPNIRLKRILCGQRQGIDPLGGNNTISMPLISQVNQTKPTVRLASVLPANVSTAVNDQSSSSGLGYHVPIESVIDRNTQRMLMNPPPSLIPQSIPLENLESSMDRNLNKSQIPASDKDTQIPIVISNSQIPSVKSEQYTEFSANNFLPSIGRLILQQDLYGFPSARLKSLICDQREESRAVLQFLLDAPFPICLDYLLDFFCELLSVDDQIIKGLRLIIWDRLLVFPVSSWTVSEAVFCGLRRLFRIVSAGWKEDTTKGLYF
ncbi:unnamed protein product [Ilex paraguariensis]|uniref:RNase H type-1 domain-containing protein n=1 Tax=Ilex paraguariensis TaxID=185542 RepID=A0ABC8TDR0_9AQUA